MQKIKKFSSLYEQFDFGESQSKVFKSKGTVLIIDFHNLMFRTVFGTLASCPEDNEEFFLTRHNILEGIFYHIKKIEPSQVIFAIDSKNSWRYSVYPEYKQNRKDRATKVNIELFYPIMDEFLDDMAKLFSNMAFIKVPRCEADDIIAIMCKKGFSMHTKVVVLSGDSDMNQLLTLPNVKQYNPKDGDYVNCINPKTGLEIKIISGDSSDNIKGIKSRVGPKTAEKIVKEGLMTYLQSPDITDNERTQILERYKRNKTLIDFDFIPKDIEQNILNTYTLYNFSAMDKDVIKEFFKKNHMTKQLEDWSHRAPKIRAIGEELR